MIRIASNNQSYIEDCEGCCNPIEVRFTVDATQEVVISFEATRLDQ